MVRNRTVEKVPPALGSIMWRMMTTNAPHSWTSHRFRIDSSRDSAQELLLDSGKSLSDWSTPQRRIICRAVVIRSADIFISLAKGGHNGNSGEHLSEMSGKIASFFPGCPVPDQDDNLLIHARDRDFVRHGNREQKSLGAQVIGGSRPGLTTSSREIQPALSLSWSCGESALGTILRRDSAQPWPLQVGTPSFGSSHCVRTT